MCVFDDVLYVVESIIVVMHSPLRLGTKNAGRAWTILGKTKRFWGRRREKLDIFRYGAAYDKSLKGKCVDLQMFIFSYDPEYKREDMPHQPGLYFSHNQQQQSQNVYNSRQRCPQQHNSCKLKETQTSSISTCQILRTTAQGCLYILSNGL